MLVAVKDVGLGYLYEAVVDKGLFHKVLHIFNGGYFAVFIDNVKYGCNLFADLFGFLAVVVVVGLKRLEYGLCYFSLVKRRQVPVPFQDELDFTHLSIPFIFLALLKPGYYICCCN
ncbi:MAG: hypothetical protein BWY70_01941 [Bacteroidetes bacterium ADurb.Bin408]|nr:MAG: hypothetical protein BWY70_01941 [Bacteroidetes bacterium ADurb.Bin408]